jgi:phosphate transport system permease protein
MKQRYVKGQIMKIICGTIAFLLAGMLILIVAICLIKGFPSLNPKFFFVTENVAGGYKGIGTGIANAIEGTLLLALSSTFLALPFGVGTAIYLQRYAPDNRYTRSLRFIIEVLAGTPSIVLGIFGVIVLVIYLKPITGGESLFAGAIALSILVLPVIIRATEDAIIRVPSELEEGSYALGATKWLTLKNITIPVALSGIVVGAILSFGRAAEESAIVILTAGYSQYAPEFKVMANPSFLLGIKIYPLNNLVGSIPTLIYTGYENSGVYPESFVFAAASVLIMLVLIINFLAKIILAYATAKMQGNQDTILSSLFEPLSDPFHRKKPKEIPSCSYVETVPLASKELFSKPEEIQTPESPNEPAREMQSLPSTAELSVDSTLSNAENLSVAPSKKKFSVGAGIKRGFNTISQKTRIFVHDTGKKETTAKMATVPGSSDYLGPIRKVKISHIRNIIVSFRSFLVTLAPFALVTVILVALTAMLPVLSPVGSNGPAGSLTVPLMTLIICVIGTVCALFLVRNSTLFLLRRQKGRMGNRRAEFAAIAIGFCFVLFGAFMFSVHIFSPVPSIQSPGSGASTGTGIFSYFTPSGNGGLSEISGLVFNNSLFSFVYKPGNGTTPQATDTSNRAAQMAALLASEETPVATTTTPQSTPAALQPSPVLSSSTAVSSPGSVVPVKNALDIGESYWYGDNSRPCLATIYNATTMPLYFYWDIDWNRFVQVTPASSGDTFLVIFIRIEDTGNMSAIVPPGAQYVVYYKGQAYYNEPYFDTSVLDANEISIYTANFNLLPYQWIREIGQQRRDYAFLTGYNIFGQNQTLESNYSANTQFAPPSATTPNGEGWFIKPGRSNAIDGYLIYEVPGAVATDLKDTYVQVPFNSFSSTQWRLGK